jgi:GNAT superfamily N-acetyltransferase
MREDELAEADSVFRLAFGTFLGLPDPMAFAGDAQYVRTRWRADPSAAFAAEAEGELVGSVFVANWGSAGFFGPLTVRPDYWDRGVAKHLMASTENRFARWNTRLAGLFTTSDSPKHIVLYQKYGYLPGALVAIAARDIPHETCGPRTSWFSEAGTEERAVTLDACREVSGAVFPGLDLSTEITSVHDQGLGDTVLLWDGDRLDGFAVCHLGSGTEAGGGRCYVKFGAVRPGPAAEGSFADLVEGCAALGAARGARTLVAGVNTGRRRAYAALLRDGFRIQHLGVCMTRGGLVGYSGPDDWVMDDLR